MKYRNARRMFGIKRPRIRQSWNKHNLFNLSRLRLPTWLDRTFFQQKWAAKSLVRGYHGEHIKERQWQRMFSRRLPSVVDMDPRYLAADDGSDMATGRGSGRQHDPATAGRDEALARFEPGQQREGLGETVSRRMAPGQKRLHGDLGSLMPNRVLTPYMQMTFAPMERRLDIAIFRALFASSARQARQFCVHGAVKVNGKPMQHPGYLLNPGDMFQVDIDKVMLATGKQKSGKTPWLQPSWWDRQPRKAKAKPTKAAEGAEEEDPVPAEDDASAEPSAEQTEAAAAAAAEEAEPEAEGKATSKELRGLIQRVRHILDEEDSAKKKIRMRQLLRRAKVVLSKVDRTHSSSGASTDMIDELTSALADVDIAAESASPSALRRQAYAETNRQQKEEALTQAESETVARLLREYEENPIDPSKPYHTPWEPRKFMAPFAFIPRYLEVNQNICAAVYLRHPVARPGYAEVPTPFPPAVNQLAFNWYLRRR